MHTPDTTLHSTSSPLAIVGLGCLFPKSTGVGAYWANIKHAVDCITDVPATHWNPDDYFDADPKKPDMTYARRGGFLTPIDFNPLEFGIAPRDIEATDTTQLLGMVAAKQALTDAKVTFQGERATDRSRVSVILGVTGTLELVIPLGARLGHPKWRKAMKDAGIPNEVAEDAVQRIAESYVPWQENSFPGLLGNVVAGRIANRLDLHGTNCVVDAACASSLSALHLAAMELATGKSDVVVTGGSDTFNDIFMYMCFSKTPALSPTGNSKPFDATGDGTILGEGLGMVVLKRLADAERDGDTVYALLKGIGTSSDGKGNAIYAPSAEGQKRCLNDAYTRAGVTPDTIELVEAHGTGTKVGDSVEASALAEVYNSVASHKSRPWCALGSVKSQIGHTKAAAGAAGLIKAVLALHYKVLPPTIKVGMPVDPLRVTDSPFYVNTQMRPWLPRAEHPRRAGLSAFGFGGSNFHAVLEEYQQSKPETDWDGQVEILAISGSTRQQIAAELTNRISDMTWKTFARAAEASRQSFDANAACRLVIVAHRDSTEIEKVIANVQSKLTSDPAGRWQTPDGAYFGSGTPGKLGVLFPGQGSQSVGMLRELSCLFPEMLDTLGIANAEIVAHQADESDACRLTDRIYPPTRFDADAKTHQDAALRATAVAQPAIGAVSFGAWRVLNERFGLIADAFAGHSYGELPALAAAGRLTMSELFTLSRLRGKLMAEQRVDDPGSMLAVFATIDQIQATISQHNLGVVPANFNAPAQTVLSGATNEIQRAEQLFTAANIRAVRLSVAAAFHSAFVSDAATPFRQALNNIALPHGTKPVYANTTAAEYPADSHAARDLLGYQLAKPVAFVDQIRSMLQAGVKTFIEVGPGSVLTRLVESTLTADSADAEVFAVDASNGKRSGVLDLGHILARLASRGYDVRLSEWERGSRCRPQPDPKPGHTVPVCGANSVLPRPQRAPRVGTFQATGNVDSAKSSVALSNDRRSSSSRVGASMADPAGLNQALQLTQQTLAALQQLQDQTAKLHQQFLDSQNQAQQTLHNLVLQQNALLFPGATPPVVAPLAPISAPPAAAKAPVPTPAVAPAPTPTSTHSPQPAVTPVATPVTSVPMTRPNLLDPPRTTRMVTPVPIAYPPPRPAAPAPAPAASNGTHTSDTRSAVEGVLLSVVAEKTGYPTNMLDLTMSLDSDLGVDSIKRVEILSALQEKLPNAPVVKPEHLGTLHTLQDIVTFLSGRAETPTVAFEPNYVPIVNPTPGSVMSYPLPLPPANARGNEVVPLGISGLDQAEVQAVLLGVVAEKTGYPTNMLDLTMSLDSDLGVDSIKRVEILSALQEKLPNAPVVKPEHLGTLHTLQDIVTFLSGEGQGAMNTAKIPVQAVRSAPRMDDVVLSGPATVAIEKISFVGPDSKTNFPSTQNRRATADLDPSLSELLTPRTEQVEEIRPHKATESSLYPLRPTPNPVSPATQTPRSPVNQTVTAETNTPAEPSRTSVMAMSVENVDRSILQAIDLDLASGRPRLPLPEGCEIWVVGQANDAFTLELVTALSGTKFQVKQYPWLDPDFAKPTGTPAALVMVAPAAPGNTPINKLGFRWMQFTGLRLRQGVRHLSATLIATIGRLDGEFGLGELETTTDPAMGGLAGLIKTARQEWPELGVKAIDLEARYAATNPRDAAAAVVDELLLAGPTEVGIATKHRCTLELARTVRRNMTTGPVLNSKDVILITGGARGVTAEVAIALAEAYKSTIILTGRTPLPATAEPIWLRSLTDEAAMKKAIAEHLGAAGSPKSVGEFFNKTISQREVTRTIASIERTGAKVAYFPVNVANGRQIADLIHQSKMKFGEITALVHGAGVIADKRIEDLTTEQFDAVYTTKVDGLRNILDLLTHQDLKAILLFSSTTARLGRVGQLAYAVANEVLNKTAQVEARRRPNARVVAINWGPWEGGMVTPALRKMFESEGIGLIPLAEGGQFAVQELAAAGKAVEVIALGKPGRTPRTSPSSSSVGSGSQRAITTPQPVTNPASISQTGPPTTNPPPAELNLVFERVLDITSHPVLKSHVLDGRAVLPMALHLEWLAHAALQNNPGLVFHGLNDLRITHGVMVEDGVSVALKAYVGKAVKNEKFFTVPVELRGKRRDGRDAIHSRAELVLAAALPKAPLAGPTPAIDLYPHSVEDVYKHFLFHGSDLHGIERIDGHSDMTFVASAYPAPSPNDWFTNCLRPAWVADPLVIDASFQMMILWSFAQHGAGSLPCFAGRYRQYRRAFPTGPVKIVIRVTRDNGSFARADIDYIDNEGLVIAQVQDYECVIDRQLDQAFRRNQLTPKAK